jgi:hypothetical protein
VAVLRGRAKFNLEWWNKTTMVTAKRCLFFKKLFSTYRQCECTYRIPLLKDSSELIFGDGPHDPVQAVVGKLLLKSNCVTLLPLLLKETSYFESVTHFSL